GAPDPCRGRRGRSREPCSSCNDLSRALVEVNFGPAGAACGRPSHDRRIGPAHPRRPPRGSAAVAVAQVADGRAEAYWGLGLQSWDAPAASSLTTTRTP